MKLPDLPVEQVQPVQGYGEVEYAQQHQGYAGEQLGRAIQETSRSLLHLGLSIRSGQLEVQALAARKDLHALRTSTLTALNTQQTISEDQLSQLYGGDIPKEVRDAIPGGTKVQFQGPDGTVHEQGRTDIPMYAVRPHLFKHIVEPNIDNIAKGIDEPGWQRAFKLGSKLDLEQQTQDVAQQSAREAVAHTNAVVVDQFQEAMRVGDWGSAELALKMGGRTITPSNLEKMQHTLQIAKSEWAPNEIIAGEDIQRLQGLKQGLQGVEANGGKFKIKDSLGQEEDIDTSMLKENQRRTFVRLADMRIRTLQHLANAQESQKDKILYQDSAGQLNRLYENGDINGIKNFQRWMRDTGRAQSFEDQDKPEKLYARANYMAKQLDPKAPKEPKENVNIIALQRAANQAARGEEVTVADPVTGERFNFSDKNFDVGSYLENAHAYTPALAQQINDLINGKRTSPAQMDHVTSQVAKALYGTNSEEMGALPPKERSAEKVRNIADKEMAVRNDFLEAVRDHGGSMSPEQVERWRQGYLKTQGTRVLSQPNSIFNTGDFSQKTFEGGALTSQVPGRVLRELQANHTQLGLPRTAEDQAAFWQEFVHPYEAALKEEYFKKFPNDTEGFNIFLLKAAAAIRDNQKRFASENITTASSVAKRVAAGFDWKTVGR